MKSFVPLIQSPLEYLTQSLLEHLIQLLLEQLPQPRVKLSVYTALQLVEDAPSDVIDSFIGRTPEGM